MHFKFVKYFEDETGVVRMCTVHTYTFYILNITVCTVFKGSVLLHNLLFQYLQTSNCDVSFADNNFSRVFSGLES